MREKWFYTVLADYVWLTRHPEHGRHIRTIDVRIDQSHFEAPFCERDSKIDRDRRLAYPALTATYGDDVFHAW